MDAQSEFLTATRMPKAVERFAPPSPAPLLSYESSHDPSALTVLE